MRGLFIIGFALLIDLLQGALAVFFVALQAITPVGGGIGAAGLCAALSDGVVNKVVNAAACLVVGAGASAYAVPIGGAIDFVISITLGSVLIAALAFSGMFYPGTVLGAFIGESIPLLDAILPGWTLLAIRSVYQKHKEEAARSAPARQGALSTITQVRQSFWEDIRTTPSQEARNTQPLYAEQAA